MRQLKNFMEAKNNMWNGKPCECITLKCRRESDASCNCDGGGGEGGKPKITWDEDYNGRIYNHGSTAEFGFTLTPKDIPLSLSWCQGIESGHIDSYGDGRYAVVLTIANVEMGWQQSCVEVQNGNTGEVLDRIDFSIIWPADSIYIDTSMPLEGTAGQIKSINFTTTPAWGYVEGINSTSDDNSIAYVDSYSSSSKALEIAFINEGTTTIHISTPSDPETVYDLDIVSKAPINQVTWDDNNPIVIDLDNTTTATKSFTYSPIDSPIDSIRLDVGSPSFFDSRKIIKDSDGVGHIELTTYVPIQDSVWISTMDGSVLSSFVGVTATSTAPYIENAWRVESKDIPVGESRTFPFAYSPENANTNTIKFGTDSNNITLGTPTFDGNGHGTIDIRGDNVGYSECYISNPYMGSAATGFNVIDNITHIDNSQTQDLSITVGDYGSNVFTYTPENLNPTILTCTSGDDTICSAWISWDGAPGTGQIMVQGISEGQTIVQFGSDVAGWYTFNVTISS